METEQPHAQQSGTGHIVPVSQYEQQSLAKIIISSIPQHRKCGVSADSTPIRTLAGETKGLPSFG